MFLDHCRLHNDGLNVLEPSLDFVLGLGSFYRANISGDGATLTPPLFLSGLKQGGVKVAMSEFPYKILVYPKIFAPFGAIGLKQGGLK